MTEVEQSFVSGFQDEIVKTGLFKKKKTMFPTFRKIKRGAGLGALILSGVLGHGLVSGAADASRDLKEEKRRGY